MEDFIHPELHARVEFFGGSYFFLEERTLPFEGQEVLYLLGLAEVESSCCGRGGFGFIKVPGIVVSWKEKKMGSGAAVSRVDPVGGEKSRKEIRRILAARHPEFQQIDFL